MRSTPSGFTRFAFISALALSPALFLGNVSGDAAAAVARASSVSGAAFYLGGSFVGNVKGVEGGSAVASVVEEPSGRGALPKKHVGAISYEPIRVELGFGVERPVFDWIDASIKGTAAPKSGALVNLDVNLEARGGREFDNAVISEAILPACDAASKEAGVIGLTLSPERVRSASSVGKASSGIGSKSKAWVSSNFRLSIDGLDTAQVLRIDPIVVRLAGQDGARDRAGRSGKVGVSNLKVTLAERGADSWQKWYEDFMIAGNAGDSKEKSGKITLLGPNLKDELAVIELGHLGLVALRQQVTEAGVAQVEAELYVESVGLSVK